MKSLDAKVPEIRDLIAKLRRGTDSSSWSLVDHWEADSFAIGITQTAKPSRILYISAFGRQRGRFYYEVETSTKRSRTGSRVDVRRENATYKEVLAALTRHLKVPLTVAHQAAGHASLSE